MITATTTTTTTTNTDKINSPHNLFSIDGPGGTDKTFLYNCIIGKVRHDLAKYYCTFCIQTTFEIIRDVPGYPIESTKAQVIRESPIILWDEAPMSPRLVIEAVERYLRDLMDTPETPIRGNIVVFGEDF
ncbi:unnamed protein product [Phaedon cochleariae]|uniref:ATP-dependent DNA helicase n=1 Tax=Phaedon cochleariae TaxID=80249 RepID=A0A9N9SI95_PHACE|nr:unnamed protein product [Phaedon cochleariae]